ncbi:MAG: hypothetical protein F9K22_07820 [Bacteroidetes bacterium]|nr:MAG: hypothetical protein F9K22_07820 [Bacteroidota bacterium]
MEHIADLLLANDLYLLIAVVLALAIVFSIIKKVLKLLLYAVIALAAFVAYVYYTGTPVQEVIEQGTEAVRKAEKEVKENETVQEVKKKAEQELKQ